MCVWVSVSVCVEVDRGKIRRYIRSFRFKQNRVGAGRRLGKRSKNKEREQLGRYLDWEWKMLRKHLRQSAPWKWVSFKVPIYWNQGLEKFSRHTHNLPKSRQIGIYCWAANPTMSQTARSSDILHVPKSIFPSLFLSRGARRRAFSVTLLGVWPKRPFSVSETANLAYYVTWGGYD